MHNFIIFYEGKEETSPLVRLLNIFEQIYTRTGKRRLGEISRNGVVGFKMRFTPPTYMGAFSRWNRLSRIVAKYHTQSFRRMMINLLQSHNIVAFLAVRQDVLKWGLSKYHGDGTGKPGHLQFRFCRES